MASRGCVIFVGNLPGDVREREVEDLFVKVRHTLQRKDPKGGGLHELECSSCLSSEIFAYVYSTEEFGI